MTRQEAIGSKLQEWKKLYPSMCYSEMLDTFIWDDLPNNRKDESLGTQTAEAYKEELRRNPDKHAQEMLRAIERGEKLEEDPSGT